MSGAEVAGLEGVGGEVSGLIRVWKSVEKSKAHPQKKRGGHLHYSLAPRGNMRSRVRSASIVRSAPASRSAWT
jgi:hypothetical protein